MNTCITTFSFLARRARVRFNMIFNLLTKLRERERERELDMGTFFFPRTPLPAPQSPSHGINPKKTSQTLVLVLCCVFVNMMVSLYIICFSFGRGNGADFLGEKKKKPPIKNRYKTHPRLCLPLVATKYSMVLGHTSIQVFVEDQILTRGRVFSRTFHVFSTLAILCFSFR